MPRGSCTSTAYRNRTTTFALEGGLSASMTIGIAVVLAIEGAAIHLWVAPRSQAWAWAITAVNVATLIWLWRDYRAASHASMTVADSTLTALRAAAAAGTLTPPVTAASRIRC